MSGLPSLLLFVCLTWGYTTAENMCIGSGCFCTKYPITVRCVNTIMDYIPERIKELATDLEMVGQNVEVLRNVHLSEWYNLKRLTLVIPDHAVCRWIKERALAYVRLKIRTIGERCKRLINTTTRSLPSKTTTGQDKYTSKTTPTKTTMMQPTLKTRKPPPIRIITTDAMIAETTYSDNVTTAGDDIPPYGNELMNERMLLSVFIPVGIFGVVSITITVRCV